MQTCKMIVGGNNETLITMCIELYTGSFSCSSMVSFFSLSLVDFLVGGGGCRGFKKPRG